MTIEKYGCDKSPVLITNAAPATLRELTDLKSPRHHDSFICFL